MSLSVTVSDYPSREGPDWECPKCTTLNNQDNLNCMTCFEGRNPYQRNITSLGQELVIEQERRHSEAQKVHRSITDRMKSLITGWKCPVCQTTVGIGHLSCSTCGHSNDPEKEPKQSTKSQKAPTNSFSWGSFFKKYWKPQNNTPKESHIPTGSTDDMHRGKDQEAMVLVTKDNENVFTNTIPPVSLDQDEVRHLMDHYSPAPSTDSGTCTMSDTDSQPTTDIEPENRVQPKSSPVTCTDPSTENTWRCTVCSAFNRLVIGQNKCYVCNIGDAPAKVMPIVAQVNVHMPNDCNHLGHVLTLPNGLNSTHRFAHHQHQDHTVYPPVATDPLQPVYYSEGIQPLQPGRVNSQQHNHFQSIQRNRMQPDLYHDGVPMQPIQQGHLLLVQQDIRHRGVIQQPYIQPTHHFHNATYSDPHDGIQPAQRDNIRQMQHTNANRAPSVSPGVVITNIDYNSPRKRASRPTVLIEENNYTKPQRRTSFDDSPCTPTPNRKYTQLMECTRRVDTHQASEKYETIQKYCLKKNEPYVDPEFPPADKSLYIDPKKPVRHWKVARWSRPQDIIDPFSNPITQWSVLRNDPDPGDIAQGVLGNCWVLSALSVIATVPELIAKVMVTRDYSHTVGAYQVRLCKDGKWQTVVIDDSLPVYKNRELVFSKAHHKQLWVPLIEKAIAKLYGSYEALNSGRVLAGLSLLTGLPCEKIRLKKQANAGEEVDQDLIWVQLLSFKESGFPMGASCGGQDIREEDYYRVGLEPNHAYSILDVLSFVTEGHTFRLLRLRNPWAKVSWNGEWSDGDPVWNHYPQLRDEKLPLGGDVGIFWIEMADIYRYFSEIDVCKYRPEWHSVSMPSQLPAGAPYQHSLLSFHVPVDTADSEVNVCVYQEAPRGNSRTKNLVDLAALVLRYPTAEVTSSGSLPLPVSCSLVVGSQIQSIVSESGFLEPGSYAVLPLAFNHWPSPGVKETEKQRGSPERNGGRDRDCVVAVFSSRMITYDFNMATRPGFMAESLFLLAADTKPKSEPYAGMRIHELCLRHGCRMIVAFNHNQHLHFTVTCNAVESQNIISTRGHLKTVDCIPPMHRQVLLVLTQLEQSEPYSIFMRIEFQKSTQNPNRKWGATHQPPLTPSIHELHSPRLC